MSSDTAALLREHAEAVASAITNEKPDRKKEEGESVPSIPNAKRTDTGKAQ